MDSGAEGLGDEAMGSESDENADEKFPGNFAGIWWWQ